MDYQSERTLSIDNVNAFRSKNMSHDVLLKIWRKYQPILAPGLSPITLFRWHPRFQTAARCSELQPWEKNSMGHFFQLGPEQDMYLKHLIFKMISEFPGSVYANL